MKLTILEGIDLKGRETNNFETSAMYWTLTELLNSYNSISGDCDTLACVRDSYFVGNYLECDLVVGDEDGQLWYLDSLFCADGDDRHVYGWVYDYDTYFNELDGNALNDPDNELQKLVRID